jgi:hypothetical protein
MCGERAFRIRERTGNESQRSAKVPRISSASRVHFCNRGGALLNARYHRFGDCLIIAFWIDHRYYDGMYSRETGDMIEHIAKSFSH